MKRPLVALLIAPVGQPDVDAEKKKITIREGWRDYEEGDTLMLCCHITRWASRMAKITLVRRTVLSDVTRSEYEDDGFALRETLVAGLKEFYPDLTPQSPVTVIRWIYI